MKPLPARIAEIVFKLSAVTRATRAPDLRPETDVEHSMMLAMLVVELCPPGIDRNKAVVLAVLHDLPEVYAGDTNTIRASAADLAGKAERERHAVERLRTEVPGLVPLIDEYEAQESLEAMFVRILDKVTPKITHYLNNCASIKAQGMTLSDLAERHRTQHEEMVARYGHVPELRSTLELLREWMDMSESSWGVDTASICAHPNIKVPVFYEAVALSLLPAEVRERWPRSEGICSDCGSYVVAYASLEHQIAGDW